MAILKLYRQNRTTNPDLMISSGSKDKFILEGLDSAAAINEIRPWPYARLELYADEGSDPTFVVPTIYPDDQGFLKVKNGVQPGLQFKCHMVLLNGAGTGESSTIGLFMNIHRPGFAGRYVTYLTAWDSDPDAPNADPDTNKGGLGDTGWTWFSKPSPYFSAQGYDFPLAQINADWFKRRRPQENIDISGTPGALLENAFPQNKFPPQPSLDIQYVPKRAAVVVGDDPTPSTPATLAFVFRPGKTGVSPFPLPVDSSAASRFALPLGPTGYRLAQRPSDDWLNGTLKLSTGKDQIDSIHQEWFVELASSDLKTFWNKEVTRYNAALRTVRAPNRVTFLPQFASAGMEPNLLDINETFNLGAEFRVRFRNYSGPVDGSPMTSPVSMGDLSITPYRIMPFGKCDAVLQFFLNLRGEVPITGDPGIENNSLFYRADISRMQKGKRLDASLGFQAKLSSQAPSSAGVKLPQQVRIGALDLMFGGEPPNDENTQIFQLINLTGSSSRIPRFSSTMQLLLLDVTPGGQDGLPSTEYAPENASDSEMHSELCMEQRFNGSAPVVIPIPPTSLLDSVAAGVQFTLDITELNTDEYSQTVDLKLKSLQGKGSNSRPRVIVVDSDPFLVAAVDYPQLSTSITGNVVALWSTRSLDGAAWQLQGDAQPFTLTLPPQGIGEEMPKNDQDIASLPLNYRLSPSATELLQPSYTPQNFAEAPWNLRRILGYPGQRDAGAGVQQLNFELLYGLSCTVDTPMLRLAEIFSLVGRIPGRMLRQNYKELDFSKVTPLALLSPAQINDAYERRRWNWSLVAELYSKRVALLEPRASGDNYGSTAGAAGASAAPEVFTLSQGVSCTFRGASDLYYNVDPDKVAAVDDDTFPTVGTGLKGGVSWPFEIPRLFHATVRNPKSSSAVVSGLALSPLGGSGKVKAGFDKDLSTITSITEIGRTSKLSVARLGRIGVFHNLARYVIEYERDTSVTKQFQNQPLAFQGIPVLRKVREFVEILEPVATLSTSAQQYPGAGCVRSIEFKQRIIPVTAVWSSNVGTNGWKIPLWYEPASHPGKPTDYVYTRPEVVFNFAGAESADVECGILSVDKLYFYTETDANADSDPHNWPVVSGVDFLPVPPPVANPTAFSTGKPHEIPAYDSATPFGLSSFTHQLDKGHGRVNVVSGRSDQAIGANLASVTLQRAPAAVSALQTALQDLHDKVRGKDGVANLYDAVRKNPADVHGIADAVCDAAKKQAYQITGKLDDAVNQAIQKEQQLLQNWFNQFQAEVNKAADEVSAYLFDGGRGPILRKAVQDARNYLIKAVDSSVNGFAHRLSGVNASANSLTQFFVRIQDTLTSAQGQLDQRKAEIVAALNTAQGRSVAISGSIENYVAVVRSDITAPLDRCNALLTQVRTQVLARAEVWMPAGSLVCHYWEANIKAGLSSAQAALSQTDVLLSYANTAADDQVKSAQDALTAMLTQAKTYVGAVAFPQPILDDSQKAVTDAQTLRAEIYKFPGTVETRIDAYITNAAKQLNLTFINTSSDIQSLVSNIAQQIINDAEAGPFSFVQNQIVNTTDGYAKKYAGYLKSYATSVSDEVCKAATNLQQAAIHQLEAYRRVLEDAVGRLAESIAQSLPPIDITMPSGVSLPVLLNRAFGEVPEIPNLGFSLPSAAYFYLPSLPHIPLTPLLTKVKDLVPNLSPLSTMLPSFALKERALPVPNLPSFDLNGIFPDFAGLKLDNLFPALKMPAGSSDAVKITHGVDTGARTAWIQADINIKTDTAVIFSIGPMALQIVQPRFTSVVRAQAGANGQVSKQATGAITGDWELVIGGTPMITLRETGLTFDKNGKLHVDVSPDRVELSAALSFIQEIIALYSSSDSGFGIYPSATGIETRLALPIPNTSMGTTGITNLTFNFLFGLSWAHDFELYAGFGLASPNAPFNLSVFILGGGGHLVATAYYRPGGSLTCQVDMALDASAALAIALGPISGSVHINLGMRFIFNSGQGDLSLGIFLLIGGEVSILSIVSAQVMLKLEATYSSGVFTCRGIFSISIKICWCFTLNVSEEVHCSLGSGGGLASLEAPMALSSADISSVPPDSILKKFPIYAHNYISLVD